MAPRRSEVAALLAHAEQWLRIGSVDELTTAHTRSHLSDGRVVGWTGPVPAGWRLVIDGESTSRSTPPALAGRFGSDNFWRRWTLAECLAKLADEPVLTWIGRHRLDDPPPASVLRRTLRLPGSILVTVAWSAELENDILARAEPDLR